MAHVSSSVAGLAVTIEKHYVAGRRDRPSPQALDIASGNTARDKQAAGSSFSCAKNLATSQLAPATAVPLLGGCREAERASCTGLETLSCASVSALGHQNSKVGGRTGEAMIGHCSQQ